MGDPIDALTSPMALGAAAGADSAHRRCGSAAAAARDGGRCPPSPVMQPVDGAATGPHAVRVVEYSGACLVLKLCGALLRMPARAVATALAYLHRFHGAPLEGPHNVNVSGRARGSRQGSIMLTRHACLRASCPAHSSSTAQAATVPWAGVSLSSRPVPLLGWRA